LGGKCDGREHWSKGFVEGALKVMVQDVSRCGGREISRCIKNEGVASMAMELLPPLLV
jgi:hypothetical protein